MKVKNSSRRSPITKKVSKNTLPSNPINPINPITSYPIAEKTALIGKAWGYTCAVLASGEIMTSTVYFVKTNGSPAFFSTLIPITLGSGFIAGGICYSAEKIASINPNKKTPKWLVSLQQNLLAKKHKPRIISIS